MIRWLSVAAGILATLVGLYLASRAHEIGFYVHGLILAAFGIGLNFWTIGHWPIDHNRDEGIAD